MSALTLFQTFLKDFNIPVTNHLGNRDEREKAKKRKKEKKVEDKKRKLKECNPKLSKDSFKMFFRRFGTKKPFEILFKKQSFCKSFSQSSFRMKNHAYGDGDDRLRINRRVPI